MPTLKVTSRDAAEKLAQTFRAGKVAIFPTDTVYGLGCILEEKALRKIFKIKNRPPDKPLPLLIADLDEALSLAYFSPAARKAATKFWPGATTLVLNSKKELPSWVCRNGKVALRIPNHPFLREVIRRLGKNIVGTSANLSGEEPAGSISKISAKILAEVDLIIDGGKIPGKASAVYDYTGVQPVLTRGGKMKIAIASDHAGFNLKVEIKEKLIKEGYEVLDFGTDSEKSVDYPEFGLAGAEAVITKKADYAILLCGTGLGMAIMANKVKGIRAVPCNDLFSVKLTRSHNNANVLCLGGRTLGPDLAWEIVSTFLNTPFAGGRHLRRINEIKRLEKTC